MCAFQIFAKDLIKRTFRSDPPSSYELCIHSRLEAISDSFINTISLYKFDYSFLTAIKTSNRRMRISSSLHSNKTCSFVSGSFPQISIDFDYLLLCILVYRSHSLFHLSMSQQSASRLSRVNIASTHASKTVVCLFSIHFWNTFVETGQHENSWCCFGSVTLQHTTSKALFKSGMCSALRLPCFSFELVF